MDKLAKIACCNICFLSDRMKACKLCQFNPSLVLPKPTEEQLRTIVHKELYKKDEK